MLEVIFSTNGVVSTLHDTNSMAHITEESNAASKLECTVYNTDESFNNIYPGLTEVQAYDTFLKELVFEGTVFSAKPSMDQNGAAKITVTCTHLISRLTKANVVGYEDPSGIVRTIVGRILDIYNANALDRHKILLGKCPITQSSQMTEQIGVLHIFSATCFDVITQVVVEKAGWNFSARYSEGSWYLDIADSMGEFSSTDIIAGVNMIDLSKTVDANELYTRIIPIGGASYIPNDYKNPNMSHMGVAPEGMPLTLYKYDLSNPDKIYIANEKLEAKYPILEKVVQFDDIAATDDTDFHDRQYDLYKKGVAEAAKLTDIIETYETTAVDLSRAGYDYETFRLNRMYHIVNGTLNVDTWLKVTCKKTDYSNPAMSELTFGPVNKAAARYLSRKGKSTDQRLNELGTAAYKTTDVRTGGMSFRNVSKADYDTSTHDARTIYTVSDSSTGKVEQYLGDTKISGEGGGWDVENAVLYDAANLHDYTVDTTLMTDISANTKLYYSATNRMVVAQGMLCYLGAEPSYSTFTGLLDDLLTANEDYIAPEYTGITSYYYSGSTVYRYEIDLKLFPLEIQIATDGKATYTWRIVQKVKTTNLSTSEVTVNTYTADRNNCTVSTLDDITDYGLILMSSRFGASSPNQILDPYIPYGYVGHNTKLDTSSISGSYNLRAMLVFKNSNQAVNKWNANYNGQVTVATWLITSRAGAITPLTNAETVFALGATQRTEPSGGGD